VRANEDDEAALVRFAVTLADGIESALPGWTLRCVTTRWREAGRSDDDAVVRRARQAGERCGDEVAPKIRELLLTDLDDQTTTPLALLRSAVRYPTQVLADAGVPPVDRDEFAVRSFPDDRYGLAPATFADLDESIAEAGLMWGAAKAHVHLARRRAEGRR
jgi:hypothetical protein